MVSPEEEDSVRALLDQHGLETSVWISDVQRLIDETTPSERDRGYTGLVNFDYETYHTFDEVRMW